ncbi:MAG: hypothetical protein ABL883_00175 [Terricaulis sp.]
MNKHYTSDLGALLAFAVLCLAPVTQASAQASLAPETRAARQELIRLGYGWDHNSHGRAIQIQDTIALDLYVRARARINPFYVGSALAEVDDPAFIRSLRAAVVAGVTRCPRIPAESLFSYIDMGTANLRAQPVGDYFEGFEDLVTLQRQREVWERAMYVCGRQHWQDSIEATIRHFEANIPAPAGDADICTAEVNAHDAAYWDRVALLSNWHASRDPLPFAERLSPSATPHQREFQRNLALYRRLYYMIDSLGLSSPDKVQAALQMYCYDRVTLALEPPSGGGQGDPPARFQLLILKGMLAAPDLRASSLENG